MSDGRSGGNPRRLRVLYLHGFEEKLTSPKPQALLRHPDLFDLDFPALGVYLTHRHSPLVGLLLSKALHRHAVVVAASCGVVYLVKHLLPVIVVWLAVGALLASFSLCWQEAKSDAFVWSVEKSLGIARARIAAQRPDVVVGFSWGGCLAAMLLGRVRPRVSVCVSECVMCV